jgi:hypothetical protein
VAGFVGYAFLTGVAFDSLTLVMAGFLLSRSWVCCVCNCLRYCSLRFRSAFLSAFFYYISFCFNSLSRSRSNIFDFSSMDLAFFNFSLSIISFYFRSSFLSFGFASSEERELESSAT